MKIINGILSVIFCIGIFSLSLTAQAKKGSTNSGDPRVANALARLEQNYIVDEKGLYLITYDVKENRRQTAYVVSETDVVFGIEMRQVFSFAAFSKPPFTQELTRKLLDENISYISAWSVIKVDDNFGLVNCMFIPADANEKLLDVAISSVVTQADKLEKELAKEDKL